MMMMMMILYSLHETYTTACEYCNAFERRKEKLLLRTTNHNKNIVDKETKISNGLYQNASDSAQSWPRDCL
jgi:hypothetical protein